MRYPYNMNNKNYKTIANNIRKSWSYAAKERNAQSVTFNIVLSHINQWAWAWMLPTLIYIVRSYIHHVFHLYTSSAGLIKILNGFNGLFQLFSTVKIG